MSYRFKFADYVYFLDLLLYGELWFVFWLKDALWFSTFTPTYRDEGPVAEVVNGAEEPELVQEKVGSCHGALIWKGRTNPLMNQSINESLNQFFWGSGWCKSSQMKSSSTQTAGAAQKRQRVAPVGAPQCSSFLKVLKDQLNSFYFCHWLYSSRHPIAVERPSQLNCFSFILMTTDSAVSRWRHQNYVWAWIQFILFHSMYLFGSHLKQVLAETNDPGDL